MAKKRFYKSIFDVIYNSRAKKQVPLSLAYILQNCLKFVGIARSLMLEWSTERDATAFSITTLSITTLSIMTLSITTLRIMTLSITTLCI